MRVWHNFWMLVPLVLFATFAKRLSAGSKRRESLCRRRRKNGPLFFETFFVHFAKSDLLLLGWIYGFYDVGWRMMDLDVFYKDLPVQFHLSGSYSDTHPSKLVFWRSLGVFGSLKLGFSKIRCLGLNVVELDGSSWRSTRCVWLIWESGS